MARHVHGQEEGEGSVAMLWSVPLAMDMDAEPYPRLSLYSITAFPPQVPPLPCAASEMGCCSFSMAFSSDARRRRRGRGVRFESPISQDASGGRNKTLTQAGLNNREFISSHIRNSREQGGSRVVESPIQQWHLGADCVSALPPSAGFFLRPVA